MGHDGIEGAGQRGLLLAIERDAAVLAQIPVREQRQFAAQQGFVIGGQHARLRGLLPVEQHVGGLQIPAQRGLGVFGGEQLDQRGAAQIAQQHEAAGFVPGQDVWHVQAGSCHQRLHLHKGAAVFLVGRRIHHDAAGAGRAVDAQVAAKAGVGRGRAQAGGQQLVALHQRRKPLFERGLPGRIGPADGAGGGGRCRGKGRWGGGGVAHG